MKSELIIVGAGGFSRQIAELVEDLNAEDAKWNLLGFLDDNPRIHGTKIFGYPVLGPVESAAAHSSARFIVGIANHRNPLVRSPIVERLGLQPERFATLVHPSARISHRARAGRGTAVMENVVVSHNVVIGDHVLISPGCVLGHDAVVGDFATFAAQVGVSGSVYIGKGAYLGGHSVVLQELRIGEGALVGIGAVVFSSVPAGVTVFGNPARKLPIMERRKPE